MPTSYPAPSEDAVKTLLAGAVAVTVKVHIADAPDPDDEAVGAFASYVTEDNAPAVLAFANPAAINAIGGPMAEVEAEAIGEANEKGVILDPAFEKFQEVAGSLAVCLNSDFTKPVTLKDVQKAPAQLSDDTNELRRQPPGRRAFRVDAEGLGSGSVILYIG